MSLLFSGPRGSFEQRWVNYAFLRDNVQHHLEGGRPSPAFAALHGISRALGERTVTLSSQQLHDELSRAAWALADKPAAQLAISGRTRAVLGLQFPIPAADETTLLEPSQLHVPMLERARTLDDVFGQLVRDLLRITEGSTEDDSFDVTDL